MCLEEVKNTQNLFFKCENVLTESNFNTTLQEYVSPASIPEDRVIVPECCVTSVVMMYCWVKSRLFGQRRNVDSVHLFKMSCTYKPLAFQVLHRFYKNISLIEFIHVLLFVPPLLDVLKIVNGTNFFKLKFVF